MHVFNGKFLKNKQSHAKVTFVCTARQWIGFILETCFRYITSDHSGRCVSNFNFLVMIIYAVAARQDPLEFFLHLSTDNSQLTMSDNYFLNVILFVAVRSGQSDFVCGGPVLYWPTVISSCPVLRLGVLEKYGCSATWNVLGKGPQLSFARAVTRSVFWVTVGLSVCAELSSETAHFLRWPGSSSLWPNPTLLAAPDNNNTEWKSFEAWSMPINKKRILN